MASNNQNTSVPSMRASQAKLSRLLKRMTVASKALVVTDKGELHKLYEMDFLIQGALQRAYDLVSGMRLLLRHDNCGAAAVLVRPLMDCVGVLSVLWTRPDAQGLLLHLLRGEAVRKYKDTSGKLLTDTQMMKYAEGIRPGIKQAYKEASSFIHFSSEHLFRPITDIKGDGRFAARFVQEPSEWSQDEKDRLGAVAVEFTSLIVGAAQSWLNAKEEGKSLLDEAARNACHS